MEPLLRVVDLRVAYRSAVAVDGVSLAVAAGEVVTVAGPNGAGKSSLLCAVSGLLGLRGGRIVGGRVDVDGRVGHVLEARRVFPELTVAENLRVGAFGLPRARRAERVAWALEQFVLLAARGNVKAGHLSGGERQLLAVARALVAEPAVLLLDEPAVGLAADAVGLVAGLVGEVAAGGGAVVVAEPEPALVPDARVVRLDRGRAVELAPV